MQTMFSWNWSKHQYILTETSGFLVLTAILAFLQGRVECVGLFIELWTGRNSLSYHERC